MKSAVISIGTELLFGSIVNTNAAWLSKELNELGIDVVYHYTMGDNPDRLKRILSLASEDCDIIICSGGLGPTEDDLTKETVCEFLGEKLVYDDSIEKRMMKKFERLNLKFADNNKKQCYVPEHGDVFKNDAGTAPGFSVRKNNKLYICMPGVPLEMKTMWNNYVKKYLMDLENAYIVSRHIEIFGVGESMVETMLLDLIDNQTDPTLATYAKEGTVEVRVTSKRSTHAEAANAVDRMTRHVMDRAGEFVFSIDGETVAEAASKRLIEKKISFSCAESPTAGLFAAKLANMPGISEVFDRGYAVYSDRSVMEELGVSRELIEKYSPYSREAAEAMAVGVHVRTGSSMCAAITGLAGPDGYKDMEPGTYHISIYYDGKLTTRSFKHNGWTRQLTRNLMADTMLNMMIYVMDGREIPESRRPAASK
ncbi:MAG: competence/damage-inducible protein A [Anaerovoracaceae bacterium]|nr:competence/damage-inducible protein A [Bacillota bacterium]MDY2670008.1 competence/damage-inducible protein A [Anaerovoracaceae bacterium]